jgi:hypothetical protein
MTLWRWLMRWAGHAALVGVLAAPVAVTGCSASMTSSSVTPTRPGSPQLAAVSATIARINDTAGGPVAVQRALLDQLAAPDERSDQLACRAATTTLGFDPAYRALRPDPDDAGALLLPTYITIYTGDRITGSDLTTLHLRVIDGRARTTALCVS